MFDSSTLPSTRSTWRPVFFLLLSCSLTMAAAAAVAIATPEPVLQSLARPTTTTINCFVSATSALFMTRAALHYQVMRPDISVNVQTIDNTPTKSGSQVLFERMVDGDADYAFSTLVPTDAQKAAFPDLMHYPAAAFPYGAVYELPLLAFPLVLDIKTLARIHSANITRWNDPAIVSLNPGARLPNVGIEVVLISESATYVNAATGAFRAADDDFRARIQQSAMPNWPYSKYDKYATAAAVDGIASYVKSHPYSIGLTLLFHATSLQGTVAHMVNLAGETVAPTFETVNNAFSDIAPTSAANLIDKVKGSPSWPMVIQGTFTIAKEFSRASCIQETELIKFLLFILNSETIIYRVAQELITAVSSQVLDQAIGLRAALQTKVRCEGLPVNVGSSTATATVGYCGLGSQSNFGRQLLLNAYTISDPLSTYALALLDEKQQIDILMQQRRVNAIDLAWVYPVAFRKMYPGVLEQVVASKQVAFFPISLVGIMPTYSLHPAVLSAMQTMSALPLKIDMEALAQVFLGDIDSWLHPTILAFNPKLAQAFASAPQVDPRMGRVLFGRGRMVDAPASALSNHFIIALNHTAAFQNSGLKWNLPADWTAVRQKLSNQGSLSYMVPGEASMAAEIAYRNGSIGYKLIEDDSPNPDTDFDIVRYVTSTTTGVTSLTVRGVPSSFRQCVDIIPIPDTDPLGNIDLESVLDRTDIEAAKCWPAGVVLNSMVLPSDVDDSALTSLGSIASAEQVRRIKSSLCFNRVKVVRFLQYVGFNTAVSSAMRFLGFEGFNFSDQWGQLNNDQFNNLKCLGNYMLHDPLNAWQLASGVKTFVYSTSLIGLFGILLSAVLVFLYRNRTIIASSDMLLQSSGLVGLALLIISTILFVQPASKAMCSGVSWSLAIGLTLTLAPQTLKLLKVYTLVTNNKKRSLLRAHQLSTLKMYAILLALLVVDVVILIVAQAPKTAGGMFHANSILQQKTSEIVAYTTCAPSSDSMPYASTLIAIKGLTLVLGSVLGFRVRHVANAFGESTKISWSMWSATVSAIIIFPLIALTGGVFDNLYVFLVNFFILWIAIGTLILLFGYKVYAVLTEAIQEYRQNSKTSRLSGRSSTGGSLATLSATGHANTLTNSLLSGTNTNGSTKTDGKNICELPDITKLPMNLRQIQRYLFALERQLEKANQRREKVGFHKKHVSAGNLSVNFHSASREAISRGDNMSFNRPASPVSANKYVMMSPTHGPSASPENSVLNSSKTSPPQAAISSDRRRLQPRQPPAAPAVTASIGQFTSLPGATSPTTVADFILKDTRPLPRPSSRSRSTGTMPSSSPISSEAAMGLSPTNSMSTLALNTRPRQPLLSQAPKGTFAIPAHVITALAGVNTSSSSSKHRLRPTESSGRLISPKPAPIAEGANEGTTFPSAVYRSLSLNQ